MSKRAFDKIKAGLDDALAFAEGRGTPSAYRVHVPETVDVKAIRARLGLSQNAFAARFGFTAAAVRDWEYGRRRPERSAPRAAHRHRPRAGSRRQGATRGLLSGPG